MSTVKNVSWFVVSIPEGKPDICWTQLNSISEHECSSLSGWTRCLDTISRFINTCLWWVNLTTARLVCLQVIPFKGNFYHQMFQPNAGLPRKRQDKESILPVKQQGFKPGIFGPQSNALATWPQVTHGLTFGKGMGRTWWWTNMVQLPTNSIVGKCWQTWPDPLLVR